jgi:ribA/ribD-fused uncharacterized protein
MFALKNASFKFSKSSHSLLRSYQSFLEGNQVAKMPKAVRKKVKATAAPKKKMDETDPTPVEVPGSDVAVYFWRPHDPNGFMSQWYISPFEHEGITYETAEMWMMIQKAKLFKDEDIADTMAKTTDPKQHKALGRKVKDFDKEVWDKEKSRIVEEGSWLKFTQSKNKDELKKLLLETGEKEIVEVSRNGMHRFGTTNSAFAI